MRIYREELYRELVEANRAAAAGPQEELSALLGPGRRQGPTPRRLARPPSLTAHAQRHTGVGASERARRIVRPAAEASRGAARGSELSQPRASR